MCIHRHPLGGRNFESYSEDPFLTGKMSSQVIQGLQSKGVAATIKHFVANEQETARTTVDETISERALREIYLRPFEIAVKEAKPWSVMTAYNLVNGTHCDANKWLLQDVLRGNWKWEGMVMSDWGGTNSVADALNAGLDLEMPGPPRIRKLPLMLAAIEKGEITSETLDARVRTVLKLAHKLEALEKEAGPVENGDRIEHRKLIRDAGARGMVLLKNDDNILPLTKEKVKGKKIALIGFSKHALAHGGGSASVNSYYRVTPEEGLRSALGDEVEFTHAKGAHKERLLPHIHKDGNVGKVTGLDGNHGFTCRLFAEGQEEPAIVKNGYPCSSYSPLGSNESFWKSVEIVGDFTPVETGSHYVASSGFGQTKIYINSELIFEQKNNTSDPMGCLFSASPEPEVRYSFVAGKTYRIRIRSEPPKNIGLEILEGRSGCRMGFSLESVHDADLQGEAARVASEADYAIVFTGHDPQWETEGQDQASFHLPHDQDGLIAAVAGANKNTIVVNSTGVAVAMPWLNEVKALLQAWFPGQECGNSIADILTGVISPEGRLPVSFPKMIEDAPAHGNFPGLVVDGQLRVKYEEGVFVGYRHYDRVPRDKLNFPFGYGLSYTNFEFGDLGILNHSNDTFDVEVEVSNVGTMAGGVLVQLYVGNKTEHTDRPVKALVGFQKLRLRVGERKTARVTIDVRDFAYFNEQAQQWVIDEGEYHVSLGSSASDLLKTASLEINRKTWNA